MRTLNLDRLQAGLPRITKISGAFYAEAAATCLTLMGHQSGVLLKVDGSLSEEFLVEWTQIISETELSSWLDLRELVEYGATGLALLLMLEFTDYQWFKRQDQDDGSDYEMRKTKDLLHDFIEARLEVSGILRESLQNTIQLRVALKERRVKKSGIQKFPVYVVVVEFGIPKAKIKKI